MSAGLFRNSGHAALAVIFAVPMSWAATATSTTCSGTELQFFGGPVSIMASVSSTAGVPTGSVDIFDGGTAIGTVALVNGAATFTTTALSLGTHIISCSFAGNATFAPSSGSVAVTIAAGSTRVVLAPSRNPSPPGQPVTISVTVSGMAPGAPLGSVTLMDGSNFLATVTLFPGDNQSMGSFTTSSLTAGTHAITATFRGDANFTAGATDKPLLLVIGLQPSTAEIRIASPAAATPGQPITIPVRVTSDFGGTPTGTVTLLEGTTTLGVGTLAAGQASIVVTNLSGGTHVIVAKFSGDATFNPSTSAPLTLNVTPATTTTVLSISPNPALAGQNVTLTATVTAPGGAIPAGTVTFQTSQGMTLGIATLNSTGQATLTTSFPASGAQAITAAFSGNSQFSGSSSVSVTATVQARTIVVALAASGSTTVAPGSLASIFGENLASASISAPAVAFPATLGGVSVVFRSAGVDRPAALAFVSPGQINAVIAADQPAGQATVIVRNASGDVATGTVMIATVAPALFSADATGTGPAAALFQTNRQDGSVTFQPTFTCAGSKCSTSPIDLGTAQDRVTLVLFGTGIRNGGQAVRVRIAGQELTPLFAGAQGQFPGLDQINVSLPQSLRGLGDVPVMIVIGDQISNSVSIRVQ